MVLFHLGDPLIDGFGRQIMRLHCCGVPDCKVLKHKRKPPGELLAGGRKAGRGRDQGRGEGKVVPAGR